MPTPAAPSDAARALLWTAAVERRQGSRAARLRALVGARSRSYRDHGRVVAAHPLPPERVDLARRLLVDRWSGQSLLDDPVTGSETARSRADVVLLGARRSSAQFRFRSFYLHPEPGQATTLVAQQRREPGQESPLLNGARVQRRARGRIPFVVPRVLAAGTVAEGLGEGVTADWALEELVDATVVPARENEQVVAEVLELLGEGWSRLGTRHVPLRASQRAAALAGFAGLSSDTSGQVWPEELDRTHLAARVRRVLADPRPMTMGLSHGDPGVGNLLRTGDGRLVLLDWEFAGHRHLTHDVAKVLRSSPDPVASTVRTTAPPGLTAAMAAAGALPWNAQVAVSLLVFLAYWRDRHERAVARGLGERSARGLRTMVQMVDVLLDV
ncbi:aminoglycoside phosphotransferase family protein [Auraticoccus cholistanensis]|uniref:aminoglycoside phosphotransferase family protein n=1 Tax=Auraticoccus cholistanensis TaxID=2656650 RepID=UPI0018D23F76